MSARDAPRIVNGFSPFASMHKACERHIVPTIKKPYRHFAFVTASIILSVLIQRLMRKPLPKTFTSEWKLEETGVTDVKEMHNAISRHRIGEKVVLPDKYLK
eukprot:TRINITY_DN22_c0_g1_i1.p1 TRINITY_DN22_c0_g1~~TRINITY_DN22_c0_g1_i1.p1  ORF type:complete len:102 (+),score=16.74 TRINITY_DN22_c0_g1_i1:45-350(+)